MKKDLSVIGGLFVLVIAIVIFGGVFGTNGLLQGPVGDKVSTPSAKVASDSTTVTIGKMNVTAKVAAKASDRQTGLSKYSSLPLDQGMLFVFDKSDIYPFWMKGMKFALDIIWIDDNKKIVFIAKNVPAEPGKNDLQLTQYKPDTNSKYVLEVNAGLVDLYNIKVGDAAGFSL